MCPNGRVGFCRGKAEGFSGSAASPALAPVKSGLLSANGVGATTALGVGRSLTAAAFNPTFLQQI